MTEEREPLFRAGGRLRRLGAVAMDGVVLAGLGALIGYVFYDWACRVGPYGRLVAFVVMPVYFGLGASAVTGGRTIGKAVCGIRVSGVDGSSLSVGRGLARGALLTWPYLLNAWAAKPLVEWPALGLVVVLAVFGVGGSILYLFLFNRRRGQAFHDLMVGSVVSRTDSVPLGRQPSLARRHQVVVASLLVLPLLVAGAGFLGWGSFGARLGQRVELWRDLYRDPRFHSVGVRYDAPHSRDTSGSMVDVQVWLKEDPVDPQALARELARKAVAYYANAEPDTLRIGLQRGYDLGIGSASSVLWAETHTPEEWTSEAAGRDLGPH